jgi:hypothetical protein
MDIHSLPELLPIPGRSHLLLFLSLGSETDLQQDGTALKLRVVALTIALLN